MAELRNVNRLYFRNVFKSTVDKRGEEGRGFPAHLVPIPSLIIHHKIIRVCILVETASLPVTYTVRQVRSGDLKHDNAVWCGK